jgi:two-component system nitrogen regulation sensor histidine kinase NtrY
MLKANRIFLLIAILSLTGLISIRFFSSSTDSSEKIIESISKNLIYQLNDVNKEATLLLSDSSQWKKITHSFFLLNGTEVEYWNNNNFLPDVRLLQEPFKIRLFQTQRGDFLLQKKVIDSTRFLVAVIPLVEKYKVLNSFLKPKWNSQLFPTEDIVILDPASSTGIPIKNNGAELFKVVLPDSILSTDQHMISEILLWYVALSFLLILIFKTTLDFYVQRKEQSGFIVLGASLVSLRLVSIYLDFPDFYSASALFDPRLFASSSINPSMGDLLLNTLVVFVISLYVFITYPKWDLISKIMEFKGNAKYLLECIFLLLALFSFLFPFFYFEIIFHNSALSLDITQTIHFDSIRLVAFTCVTLATISSFCLCHVFFQLFLSSNGRKWTLFALELITVASVFVLYFLIIERDYWITLFCGSIYFVIIFFFKLSTTLKHITYVTFFYFLTSIFLYSIQSAFTIRRFSDEEKIASQFRFADEFLTGRDFLGEYLLNESLAKIKNDPFIQNRMGNPFLSKSSIRQKVRQIYLNNYFDRYDIGIYLYNSVGDPLDSEPFLDFATQVQTYESQVSTTGYAGIYFTSDGKNEADRRYLTIVPINRSSIPLGFVVIELTMKKLVPRNVYPELLIDNRFAVYLQSRNFSYAIYSKGQVASSFGEFNYDRDFNIAALGSPDLYSKGIENHEFVHVGVEDDDERVAVVSSGLYPLFFIVANFSFWVVISIFIVLIGLAMQGFYFWLKGERINYSSRVQLYFYSSLFVPLLVVGITTLSITTRSAATQLNTDFINKAKLVRESLIPDLIGFVEDQSMGKVELEKKVIDVARVSDVDATVYDANGKLIGSSQPLIYDYQFKSELIDREAFDKVVKEKEVTFVKQDKIGTLDYFSAYCALRSPRSGKLLGFVALPFFGSASSLEKTQIIILANILSIFMVVLLMFSVFSLFAADQLTFPLRKIARSLGRTTLTGHNEPLEWNSSDEIGIMVKEYNRMVQNLDQSKLELARSQKESAWREMAKQVAHEIKNPLTPMKLSLQQMEQLMRSEEGLSKEKTERSIKMMLTQVEILNEIASSFSTFARMPSPVMVKIELNTIVKKTVDLYSNQTSDKVNWTPSPTPVFILADEQLLVRIFSNIILNGLQSGNGQRLVSVNVNVRLENSYAVVSIADDGTGISPELHEKIFVPYFSTKKSGSGLGLAIVKQGVEQSGGTIRLVSEEGRGSIFYLQFPVVLN